MSDLIERLRDPYIVGCVGFTDVVLEAADTIESQSKRIAELESEVAALRVDAERYRWLREASKKKVDFHSREHRWMVSRDNGDGTGQNLFGEKIDAEIDAAIKEQQ